MIIQIRITHRVVELSQVTGKDLSQGRSQEWNTACVEGEAL
jgi:hypothetical protein